MANLKIFKCVHCKTRFVIMPTRRHELLPIEIKEGINIDEDEIYSEERHVSHLKNCKGRQSDWNEVRKKYEKRFINYGAIT